MVILSIDTDWGSEYFYTLLRDVKLGMNLMEDTFIIFRNKICYFDLCS